MYHKVDTSTLQHSPPTELLWGTTWLSNGRSHICISTGYHWYNEHPLWPSELVRITEVRYAHMERWDRMFFDCQDLLFIDDTVDHLLAYLKHMVHDGFVLYAGTDDRYFPTIVQPDFVIPERIRCACARNCVLCRVQQWVYTDVFALKIET